MNPQQAEEQETQVHEILGSISRHMTLLEKDCLYQ